jgi:glycosyltransferase involved in cell wall biosynthesis
VINTYSQDEPLNEILAAAAKLPTVSFHITGNPKHARGHRMGSLPRNAHLTGWLSENEYAALLLGSDVVVCLTTHDHTMQRGAYEAMALSKPLITSDWDLLRKTFHRGTLHVRNTPDEIANAVLQALDKRATLASEMHRLSVERSDAFAANLRQLLDALA